MPPVNVPFVAQLQAGLCGAACAQMILRAQNLVGAGAAVQLGLWEDIKSNTNASAVVRPRGPFVDNSPCGPFPRKVCEACNRRVLCWCTFPTALRKTLADHGSGCRIIRSSREPFINDRLKACLLNGVAPAVLVQRGRHWVVVDGIDQTSPTPISLLDPELDAQISMTVDAWNTDYLAVVRCGQYQNVSVIVGQD